MRSWSKWKIFSRKWKSSSAVGPRAADPQRVLVVGNGRALLRRQDRDVAAGDLVRLAALAAEDRLVAQLAGLAAGVAVLRLLEEPFAISFSSF